MSMLRVNYLSSCHNFVDWDNFIGVSLPWNHLRFSWFSRYSCHIYVLSWHYLSRIILEEWLSNYTWRSFSKSWRQLCKGRLLQAAKPFSQEILMLQNGQIHSFFFVWKLVTNSLNSLVSQMCQNQRWSNSFQKKESKSFHCCLSWFGRW